MLVKNVNVDNFRLFRNSVNLDFFDNFTQFRITDTIPKIKALQKVKKNGII
jgi:hypothetical protein